jgi:hypothetical protein
MSQLPKGFKLPDDSLDGVLIWMAIFSSIFVVSILLFEFVRLHGKWQKVYYTRVNVLKSVIEVPRTWFGWIGTVFRIPESTIRNEIGLDAYMYLNYLEMCFIILGCITTLIFAVLLPSESLF